jgi:hypothetical protein
VRRRGWLLAAAVAAAAALVLVLLLTQGGGPPRRHTAGPPPVPAPAPAPAAVQLGANTGRLFNGQPYPEAQVLAQLAALRQTGATLARSDALWETTEPSPPVGGVHRYQWAFDDTIAGSLAAEGLRWLPIVDYAPGWAATQPAAGHSPPRAVDQYAAYAGALAGRYGAGGAFWRAHPGLAARPVDTYEVWNEPDNSLFWSPGPQPAAYARLYLAARQAIRAVQPDARVIVGGLTQPTRFLPALLGAVPGLRGQLDGVGIHPYAPTPGAVMARVRRARATLNALGLGQAPLYVTEFGWTTHPPGALDYLPERLRPAYIQQTLSDLEGSGCGLAAALLYAWVTPERDPADSQDWFGISPPQGGASPDSQAFAQAIAAAPPVGRTAGGC